MVQRDFYDGNFHIFYYFLAGVPEEKRHKFHLGEMSEYKYVHHGALNFLIAGCSYPNFSEFFLSSHTFPSVS